MDDFGSRMIKYIYIYSYLLKEKVVRSGKVERIQILVLIKLFCFKKKLNCFDLLIIWIQI